MEAMSRQNWPLATHDSSRVVVPGEVASFTGSWSQKLLHGIVF